MDSLLAKKLEDFRDKVRTEAEAVIYRTFPSKILELQETLDKFSLVSSDFLAEAANTTDTKVYDAHISFEHHQEPQTKKRKLLGEGEVKSENGALDCRNDAPYRYPSRVSTNKHLSPVLDIVRKHCETLVETCDKVKLWVNITMPKIEDGDNFGVQVQEEALSEIHRAQEAAYNMRDAIRGQYLARGKIASKLLKYPNLEDYALALREHDNKQFYLARQHLIDIRNIYAVLTDIFHKNMAKIRAPKGNNAGNLY